MSSPGDRCQPVPAPRRAPAPRLVDVVIVGGGIMGVATAWQLARTGHEVVLLERFRPGHDRGAGHATSRIHRQAQASEPHVRLAAEALPLWREIERETGADLLRITGGIDHGDPARTAQLAAGLAAHGIGHRLLDPEAAAARWPGMRFDGPVLHQPDRTGRLHADHAVAALAAAAIGHGARIRYSTTATAVTVHGEDRVEIATSAGPVLARRAVVAAGAGTDALLRGHVEPAPLQVPGIGRPTSPSARTGPTCCAGPRSSTTRARPRHGRVVCTGWPARRPASRSPSTVPGRRGSCSAATSRRTCPAWTTAGPSRSCAPTRPHRRRPS